MATRPRAATAERLEALRTLSRDLFAGEQHALFDLEEPPGPQAVESFSVEGISFPPLAAQKGVRLHLADQAELAGAPVEVDGLRLELDVVGVTLAEDGRQALTLLRQRPDAYDAVLIFA